MDVAVKGMFWLLEEFRVNPVAKQFVLISGDCSVGHIMQRYGEPVTELSPHRPYPGCYALSKVLEETMLEQYYIQYGTNGCCLRASWIMEKDDFKFALKFGPDQFGGPRWTDVISAEEELQYARAEAVPLMLDYEGNPLLRGFVHVSDLVPAILAAIDNPAAQQELFNVVMNKPVDYREVAQRLEETRGMKAVPIATPYYSNWLDNAKARMRLGWEPKYDLERLIDEAFSYSRSSDDPRTVAYPG
ncbi:MAG TPA: NAD(P)-dependent oxidoreductase, partial [Paracoccaceae bacterium]|nr:NAD(P)-dependent oxidoreductase [Paracoccaceae bacterium]